MKIAVIIPAAGASTRFRQDADALGHGRSKLDEDLGGRPVLQRTVELFTRDDRVSAIVVAGPADPEASDEFRLRHGDKLSLLGATLCAGGAEHRWQSVRNALEHVPEECTHVAVHDAARPATPPELIERVFEAAQHHAAVVPVVAVPDTVKRLGGESEVESAPDPLATILGSEGAGARARPRVVAETLDRRDLVLVQTPQVFEQGLLLRAYAQDDLSSTDDAGLVERLGGVVVAIEGDPRNVKITRGADVPLVRAILGFRAPSDRPTHKKF